MTPPPPAVLLDGLERRFGDVRAVDGMTWSAAGGSVTAVLGPNGAGKTTAIECAVGLQRADGGSVRVLGVDPWQSRPEHRARVGVMLQSGGLPNGTKPIRLLRHLAALYAAPADVDALAARLGIDRFAGTTVRRLSGGQKQRVSLAAALIGRPEVVFLDEPTAGLDPHGRLDVYDLVEQLRDEGTTVVVTTHSFEEAERLADHLVIISEGRTVAEGPVADVIGSASLETVYFDLTRKVRR
ncbi:ABC transporter ATP-binding protein [Lapillicoccus sp.]|uniref:ABC transporter ATP-binding protein n=1 Tax=Lapillicoccus sp. TaxID=1909287 RepID=UPI0025FDDE1B|nr:ABC transporter ATP-binding protein [Lapillicoccus sp.]